MLMFVSFCSRILVGAPEDQPRHMDPAVKRPGAVYKCAPGFRGHPAENDRAIPLDMCDEMIFDTVRSEYKYLSAKS
jgi:hypothetical protein